MIGFFPNIYEDELVYSLLARYYVQTGLGMFRGVSEELFTDKSSYVEIEFINKLNPEVLKVIKKNCSMEELLFEHTMFPLYGRFISKERRENRRYHHS